MLPIKTYRVIKEYKSGAKQYHDILRNLKKGDVFHATDLLQYNGNSYTIKKALNHARRHGIIQSDDSNTSIDDFRELETVQYWSNQLKQTQTKNIQRNGGTRKIYIINACSFHNWLRGREFTFKDTTQTDANTFETWDNTVLLEGLEHLLKLYQNSYNSMPHFVRIIKQFLMDPAHDGKKSSSITVLMSAIKSYFAKNEAPIRFEFDPDINYDNTKSSMEQTSLSLEEIFRMLTDGRPNIMEKAMILCKFHRGLDNSTFADSFNYEAWQQLVEYFGTDEYQKWDESLCPVPIRLIRVKTQFIHDGFLDSDAIQALKAYLRHRYKLTGQVMANRQPLFLTSKKKPVTTGYIYDTVRKLLKNADMQERLEEYTASIRYKKNSHEFRDTLESILIASGCSADVADHVIGHSPKNSYEKQFELYPERTRNEYMKASSTLNIFTHMMTLLTRN